MQRLSLLLLLIPFWLLAGCSDDDDGAGATAVVQPATTQAASSSSEAAIKGSIAVDFTGSPEEREKVEATFEVAPGATAWDAIKTALGEENLTYEDFGGALGIFISGFHGVEVEGNHFWEFKVNGEGSEVGVSSYQVQQGDVLEFVYSSF